MKVTMKVPALQSSGLPLSLLLQLRHCARQTETWRGGSTQAESPRAEAEPRSLVCSEVIRVRTSVLSPGVLEPYPQKHLSCCQGLLHTQLLFSVTQFPHARNKRIEPVPPSNPLLDTPP